MTSLRHLFRRRHSTYWYRGFAGVPGYITCLSCGNKQPDMSVPCGGRAERKLRDAEKAEWWANWLDHLAAGDLPPA